MLQLLIKEDKKRSVIEKCGQEKSATENAAKKIAICHTVDRKETRRKGEPCRLYCPSYAKVQTL